MAIEQGKVGNGVQLDPWQTITGVGWPSGVYFWAQYNWATSGLPDLDTKTVVSGYGTSGWFQGGGMPPYHVWSGDNTNFSAQENIAVHLKLIRDVSPSTQTVTVQFNANWFRTQQPGQVLLRMRSVKWNRDIGNAILSPNFPSGNYIQAMDRYFTVTAYHQVASFVHQYLGTATINTKTGEFTF